MNKHVVFWSGVLGAFLFALASILGGMWIEGYSFIGQYISESFATGVPNAEYLRYMYITSGILLIAFSLMTPTLLPRGKGIKIGFFAFAFFYGLGNIIVSLFPCDFGCPTDIEVSSIAQLIHNFSAFLTYVVVPFCLIGIGAALKKYRQYQRLSLVSSICGALALVFVLLLFGNPEGSFIGLFQRIIEGSILLWVILTAFAIRKSSTSQL